MNFIEKDHFLLLPFLVVYLEHSFLCSGTEQDGKYKDTVNLPKTKFGMRANSLVREPEIQKLWEDNQVFKKVSDRNDGASFIHVYCASWTSIDAAFDIFFDNLAGYFRSS